MLNNCLMIYLNDDIDKREIVMFWNLVGYILN